MAVSVFPAAAASPYGGTIAAIGFQQGGSTGTVTFTGLDAYKRVVIYFQGIDSNASGSLLVRINSDSNDNYGFEGIQVNSSGTSTPNNAVRANGINLGGMNASGPNNTDGVGIITFENSNSAGYKVGDFSATLRDNGGTRTCRQNSFIWTSTAAISSVLFVNTGGTFNVQSGTTAGFYAIGYN